MQDLGDIIERLETLRQESDNSDMEKAALFTTVKEGKLYKDGYKTFATFCDAVKYHRSTVYLLIRCYAQPVIREAYTDIGALNAQSIIKAQKHLTEDDTAFLVQYAKDGHNTTAVKEQIATLCDLHKNAEGDKDNADATLPELLAEKTKLLREKTELEARLTEVNAELDNIEKRIMDCVG